MANKQENELELFLYDMQEQSKFYKPTSFWQEASKIIVDDIYKEDINNFRRLPSSLGMFAPVYSYPDYMQNKTLFDATKSALESVTSDIKSNLKLDMLFEGKLQAFADYRVLVAGNRDYAPFTDKVSESEIGNPLEHFTFDRRNFSRSFLNYLLGLTFMKQHVDTSSIRTVMEIGGGFGTLGEILLGDERNNCFYINADIPPVSFISSYYLKEIFGIENIADYDALRHEEILDISRLKNRYKAINIAAWQVPLLRGNIDLFVNFISFQEMEPDVVANYCKYIRALNPKYILLRNIKEGKKKKDEQTLYGVEKPILGSDYDNFFPEHTLIASDGSVFGFATEDGFHSQLRLYLKK
jgi:putative sugar O-methyltransferase